MPDRVGQDEEYLRAALSDLESAIRLLMFAERPGWADEIARVRNAIEKDLRSGASDQASNPAPGSVSATPEGSQRGRNKR